MGMTQKMSLIERLNRIFSQPGNFDISGMCNPELVTVELARDLWDSYAKPGEWCRLAKAGYDIHNLGRGCGLIGKVVKKTDRSKRYTEYLKLYYDQDFPAQIEAEKHKLLEQVTAEKEAEADE